jgi:hypothetical protein
MLLSILLISLHFMRFTSEVKMVLCYYVPDHNVPYCLKRPCINTSLDSLRPLFKKSLLKYLIWSLRPLYFMSPVWNVPGC